MAMPGALDTVATAFSEAFGFFGKNPGELTVAFLKVALVSFVIQMAFAAVAIGAVFAIDGAAGNIAVMAVAGLGGLVLVLGLVAANLAATAVPYLIVHEGTKGKKVPIIANVKKLFLPMVRYSLVVIGLTVAVFALPVIFILATGAGGEEMALLGSLLMLLAVIVFLGVIFLVQFAIPEIAVNGRGVVEGLKRSAALVRGRLAATFIYDIILIAAVFVFSLIFGIAQTVLTSGASPSSVSGVIVVFTLSSIASLAEALVLSLISVSLNYFFWRAISGAPSK
jgi:hypothetical protein